MDDSAAIKECLASRRARITAELAGRPAYGSHRRVQGLRREEIAMLGSLSVDHYARLERGNLSDTSDSVLDGVACALHLDNARPPVPVRPRPLHPLASAAARHRWPPMDDEV